jgi:alkylresorcinol/alkylpyrone synthase
MSEPVALRGLASAVPPHRIGQAEAMRMADIIFARTIARFPQLREVFVNAGIDERYSAAPLEWFECDHDWPERTRMYLDAASALFVEAARRALTGAGLAARDVDVVVSVSSTGIATPSLEARVSTSLGLRRNVSRVPIFGLGCAGGVSGLSIGARLARSEPGLVVLVVAVELCTLAFRRDRAAKADVISAALFGDGAAAAVLQAGGPQLAQARITAACEHTWPRTLDIMGWSVDPVGFGVVLSRSLPKFVERRFTGPARRFADRLKLQSNPRFVCHPGGLKVLKAVESALGIDAAALAVERDVLRRYGNMSAPTVLFVLERVLGGGFAGDAILAALGPGFTASFLSLEVGHG